MEKIVPSQQDRQNGSREELKLYRVTRQDDGVTVNPTPFSQVYVTQGTRTYISLVVSDCRCSSIAFEVLRID